MRSDDITARLQHAPKGIDLSRTDGRISPGAILQRAAAIQLRKAITFGASVDAGMSGERFIPARTTNGLAWVSTETREDQVGEPVALRTGQS